MAKYVINKSTLTGIADAIRSKEGSTAAIPVPDMKERILNIQTGVDTSDATATEGDVVSPKTFYANGEKHTGNIPSKAAATITPGTTDVVIDKNQYLAGDQTIKGDSNLIAENIKSGVSIFGIAGSLAGGKIYTGTVEIPPNAAGLMNEGIFEIGVEPSSNDTFIMVLDLLGGALTDLDNCIVALYHCPGSDATLQDTGVMVYGTTNDGACAEKHTDIQYYCGDTPFGTDSTGIAIFLNDAYFATEVYRWFLIKGEVVT